MTHGSLFSGIGGFDLAAEWMGWQNKFHCEINPFCKRVLNYYWPDAKSYDDIKTTGFTFWRGKIDILTGGFPCQPYSVAGKRKGKNDDRHLWPEMLRAIREIQPTWVVGENVPGLLSWEGGMVLDEIKANLEAEGFEVFPPLVLPACAVNAPHRRDRIWFIAHARHTGDTGRIKFKEGQQPEGRRSARGIITPSSGTSTTPNTSSEGLQVASRREQRIVYGKARAHKRREPCGVFTKGGRWENFPTQSPVCSGDDELPRKLDGITFSKWRNESIKGYGNSVVPRLVYEIFKAIEQYETK